MAQQTMTVSVTVQCTHTHVSTGGLPVRHSRHSVNFKHYFLSRVTQSKLTTLSEFRYQALFKNQPGQSCYSIFHTLVSLPPTTLPLWVSISVCSGEIAAGLGRPGRKSYWFLLCSCSQIPVWAATGICLYRSLPMCFQDLTCLFPGCSPPPFWASQLVQLPSLNRPCVCDQPPNGCLCLMSLY